MLEKLFGTGTTAMAKAMGALSMRQRAIAENIANADTPHYKRLEVAFEGQLQQAVYKSDEGNDLPMETADPRHFRIGGPQDLEAFQAQLTRADDTAMRNDGNNVDVDAEMTRLAQTSMTYNTLADMMKRRFAGLKSVIHGSP